MSIRADVTDGATCQGSIIYDDGRSQALATQTESRQRCRWDAVVATDAPYGPARVALTVSQGSGQTTLAGSFEIGRRSDDAQVLVGIKDLASTVRGGGAFIIRALVPKGATCSGSVVYHGASQSLAEMALGGPVGLRLNLSPDVRVFAFLAALSIATAVVFGLVPARRSTRADLAPAFNGLRRGAGNAAKHRASFLAAGRSHRW